MRKMMQTLLMAGVTLAVVPTLAYAQAGGGAGGASPGGVSTGAPAGGVGGVSTGAPAGGRGGVSPGAPGTGMRQSDSDASGTTGDLSPRGPGTPSVSDQQDVPSVGGSTAAGQGSGRMTRPGAQGQGGTANMGFDSAAGASREYVPMPRGAARGRPCFAEAWDFDQRLKMAMNPSQPQAGQFPEATQMRNQGMEACNAGRVQEGQRMIREATQRLGS